MTASPYGGEDQPTRLEALADDAPYMNPTDVARLTARYTATNMGHLYGPPVQPGDCYCGHSIEDHGATSHEPGNCPWCDCPQYVEHAAVLATRDALDTDDVLDGERHRTDNLEAAIELERRARKRRTA